MRIIILTSYHHYKEMMKEKSLQLRETKQSSLKNRENQARAGRKGLQKSQRGTGPERCASAEVMVSFHAHHPYQMFSAIL